MVASDEETVPKQAEAVEWDVDMEIQLLYAMAKHRPVGINKHFQMACIWNELPASMTKEITTRDIWKHLDTMYNISILDKLEPIPFPNDVVPFSLPESEFGDLIIKKRAEVALAEESDDSKSLLPAPIRKHRRLSSKCIRHRGIANTARKRKYKALAARTRKPSSSSNDSSDTPSIKSGRASVYSYSQASVDSSDSEPMQKPERKTLTKKAKRKKHSDSLARYKLPTREDYARRGRPASHASRKPNNDAPIMGTRTLQNRPSYEHFF